MHALSVLFRWMKTVLPLLVVFLFCVGASRRALACGASAGGAVGVSSCSLEEHQEETRKKWHVGAGYSFTSTGLRFGDALRPDESRHVALASLDYRYTRRWTFEVGLGTVLAGQLRTATASYDFAPGLLAAVGASWRVLDADEARPFLLFTGQIAFAATSTRQTGSDAAAVGYHALDARMGAVVGWTVWRAVTPYALARAFGGPIYWQAEGNDQIGTDVHHYQFGAGIDILVLQALDVFFEGVPLGEQGLAAGAGLAF
jgi:hypothetical protein